MAKYSDDELKVIFDESGGKCSYCHIRLVFEDYGKGWGLEWEVDHGKPVSRGGTDDINNLHASCRACNREKSDKTPDEYRRSLAPPRPR